MSDYIWTPSGTDITARWRRMGWVPPSELLVYQRKWSSYKELSLRTLTDADRAAVKPLITDNVIIYPWGIHDRA